jgi:hypothetical protein
MLVLSMSYGRNGGGRGFSFLDFLAVLWILSLCLKVLRYPVGWVLAALLVAVTCYSMSQPQPPGELEQAALDETPRAIRLCKDSLRSTKGWVFDNATYTGGGRVDVGFHRGGMQAFCTTLFNEVYQIDYQRSPKTLQQIADSVRVARARGGSAGGHTKSTKPR